MSIAIYVMTHKPFDPPTDPMYLPLQVGREGKEDLGYLCDNTGENISHLNCYYSELTGFYWIWKNVTDYDYIGTCHYRRYLIGPQGHTLSAPEYEDCLSRYDLITTRRVVLNNSYHFGFSANHNGHILDVTGEVIRDLYPSCHPLFEQLVHENETYFGNMIVTSHALFNEYCSFLFSVFEEVSRRTSLENGEDDYHKRVFGFISEFLLLVWVRFKNLKVMECQVAMIGEKAETGELKQLLALHFRNREVKEAKRLLLSALEKRPDLLMEASDITGELHLCMQIISTCEFELDGTGSCILDRVSSYRELIRTFSQLNDLAARGDLKEKAITGQTRQWLTDHFVSDAAVTIARKLLEA